LNYLETVYPTHVFYLIAILATGLLPQMLKPIGNRYF